MSGSKSVHYGNSYPWNRSSGPKTNRPYSEVEITGPSGTVRVWCLVDSGADLILLDAAIASTCGIALSGPGTTLRTLMTASGAGLSVTEVAGVRLVVDGKPHTDDVRFAVGGLALLGRVTFLNAFGDLGFDVSGWHTP